MKFFIKIACVLCMGGLFFSCAISFSFTGGSPIDYTKISSISIKDFPNVAPLVYAPLSQQFTELLKDKYTRQTKLRVIPNAGDLDIEGEITGYNFTPLTVTDGMYASQTRLTVSVRVRYTNNSDPERDFERTFTAQNEFSNDLLIDQIQDELNEGIMKEIIDQIFNETIATW